MKQTFKKFACAVLATVSALGCAATLTACETAYPQVEMTLSFNGKNYTLEYELSRKLAPATVKHFLALAGNGYYDGLCIHDYDDERMYTGAYSVTAEAPAELVHKNYFSTVATYSNFPASVWTDLEKKNTTYTLRGEFESNNVTVESGALSETYGSLTMYYYDMPSSADHDVYTVRVKDNKLGRGDYQYNHTTSEFFISLTASKKANNDYCTFATITKEGEKELKALVSAIDEYVDDNYPENDEDFLEDVHSKVFENDPILHEYGVEEDFEIPSSPIVVKKVKVKKY